MGRSTEKPITEKKFSAPQDVSVYHGDPEELSPIAAELLEEPKNRDEKKVNQKRLAARGNDNGERRTK